jgi:ABC-type polar amino acid transport system ATPase subunit
MTGDAVQIDNLHLHRETRPILRGLNLRVGRGEFVALMGASGSGKTTALRALAGLEAFQSGSISVDGVMIARGGAKPSRDQFRKVGMVFQFHCLFEHLSVMDNLCLGPVHAHRISRSDAEARGNKLLTAFGVDHRAKAMPRELSGGEAQRVAIARALAVDPPVLLMDEPTASLDPLRRSELGELLGGLVREGRTLVVSTHDEEFAATWATRIVRLRDGAIADADAPPRPA